MKKILTWQKMRKSRLENKKFPQKWKFSG